MGMPIPESIKNAPQLRMGLELYLGAFLDLDQDRPVGFGLAPIPWGTVFDYCARLDIVGEQREDLLYHVKALDAVYRQHQNKD